MERTVEISGAETDGDFSVAGCQIFSIERSSLGDGRNS